VGTPCVRTGPGAMRVVVVGGGPAGAEAARIAALRGHTVVVLEREDALGGSLELWSRLPGRAQLAKQVAWWTARLDDLDVDVRTGSVLEFDPDVVVLASGAKYGAVARMA
jgi:NADPH-dependent 2,4-dienoyl-CoA reductase/sulfur reductase-like enzyme